MAESNQSPAESGSLSEVYALIWRSRRKEGDPEFQPEFEARIPRLMTWLRALRDGGHLLACGGGGFAETAGGLTIVRAANLEAARALGAGTPMNEIGSTDVFIWDVFFANLAVPRAF